MLGRRFDRVLKAAFEPRHYLGLLRGLWVYRRPFRQIWRYVAMTGAYPDRVAVRTPLGPVEIDLFAPDDLVTVNEIFCRNDYRPRVPLEVVVDLGANIGVSALYWLSRNERAFAYLYEPLPRNVERLRRNLSGFEGRFEIVEAAVGLADGRATFHWEPTGRYGGLTQAGLAETVEVACLDAATVFREIHERHGRIDLLKVDVEGLEVDILDRLPDDIRRDIAQIVVEHPYESNPWADIFHMDVRGLVTTFMRR